MPIGQKRDMLFRFMGDSRDLERAARRAERSVSSVGNAATPANKAVVGLRRGAIALGGVMAGAGFVRGVNEAVTAASDLVESVNAVQVATGDASAKILQFGLSADKNLGMSKKTINDMAVAFSAFARNIRPEDVGGVFEEYITRASDFASVMNLDVADAVSIFQSTMAGEIRPIRQFGIDASAATVKAYAYANGIAEMGTELSETQKQQARFAVLMEQTDRFAGDFANTSDELANSQRILNAEWENAKAELGDNLLPLFKDGTQALAAFTAGVPDAVNAFGVGVQAIDRAGARVADGLLGWAGVDWWTDADEGLYQLSRRMGQVNDDLEAGRVPAEIARDVIADLGREGQLTADNFGILQDELNLTNAQMLSAGEAALKWGQSGNMSKREIMDLVAILKPLRHEAARAAVAMEEDLAEGARDLAWETLQAAQNTEELAEETKGLYETMANAADPVWQAKQALEKWNTTVADAKEDGMVTREELEEMAQAFGDLKAAEEAVGTENTVAAMDLMREAANEAGLAVGVLDEKLQGLGTEQGGREQLEDLVGRLEGLTGRALKIDLSSINLASQAQIEQAVTRAILSLQRRGYIVQIPL